MSSTIDTTKCILLYAYVPGKEQLIKSINCNYFEHTGFPCSEWIDTFFTDNLATLSNLTHFAFMYENNGRHMALFPRDVDYDEYFGKFFTYFLEKLVALNSGIIIDIITCNINTDQQKARIAALESQFNIDIRYSLNETGDYNKGGDWLMESDNVNIKDTYFNANINDWNHVLLFSEVDIQFSHWFDVSGNRIILWTDISGNEVNPIYDASNNVISVPNGRIFNKTEITVSDKVHAVLENGAVSTWNNKLISGNYGTSATNTISVYENGTTISSKVLYFDENNNRNEITLTNVKYIVGTPSTGAAMLNNGSVVIFGVTRDICTLKSYPSNAYVSVSAQLQSGVVTILTVTQGASAALKRDGSVVTWGIHTSGGNMNFPVDVSAQLQSNVKMIFSNSPSNQGFAALKQDGSIFLWGNVNINNRYNNINVSGLLQNNTKMLYPWWWGWGALTTNNTIYLWATNSSSVVTISNVVCLLPQLMSGSWIALKQDGSVVTGTDFNTPSTTTPSVSSFLQSNVSVLYNNYYSSAALKQNGSVIIWGTTGIDNWNSVSGQLQSGCVEVARLGVTGWIVRKSNGSVVLVGDITNTFVTPFVSGLLASGVKRIYRDSQFLRYRDPVAESPSNRFTIAGTPIEKNFLSIENNLISP